MKYFRAVAFCVPLKYTFFMLRRAFKNFFNSAGCPDSADFFNSFNFAFACGVLFLSLLCFSCKGKSVQVQDSGEISVSSSYRFYYFSDGFYKPAAKVSEIPAVPAKPWTESVRISSVSSLSSSSLSSGFGSSDFVSDFQNSSDSASAENLASKAFAVVNRLGIMVFQDDLVSFYPDSQLFQGRTAGNLVFYDGTPLYSLYRSSFFNDSKFSERGFHPFLVQFSDEQKISYPVVNVENLGFGADTEITDYVWDGKTFVLSAKNSGDSKIDFSYLAFQPKENLLSITPETASSKIHVTESSVKTFREVQAIQDYKNAPERIKDVLKSVKKSEFLVSVKTAGGHSPRKFMKSKSYAANENFVEENGTSENRMSGLEKSPLSAEAILSDLWCGVLFQDGTFFMKGSLEGERIINGGKTVALRLPKLPAGFSYTGFAVSGRTLYASWEETDFYKTGRSGFISVDLKKLLY